MKISQLKAQSSKKKRALTPLERANQALAMIVNGFAGGEEFAKAIASGDVCSKADNRARGAICSTCPSKCNQGIWGLTPSSWCGPPLLGVDYPVIGAKTCGCLLFGKLWVASAECPQKQWGPVKRRRKAEAETRVGVTFGDGGMRNG